MQRAARQERVKLIVIKQGLGVITYRAITDSTEGMRLGEVKVGLIEPLVIVLTKRRGLTREVTGLG